MWAHNEYPTHAHTKHEPKKNINKAAFSTFNVSYYTYTAAKFHLFLIFKPIVSLLRKHQSYGNIKIYH